MTIPSEEYQKLRVLLLDLKAEMQEMRMHLRRQDDAIGRLHGIVFEGMASKERKQAIEAFDHLYGTGEVQIPPDIAKLLKGEDG